MKEHKLAKKIHAWADGEIIQQHVCGSLWEGRQFPDWSLPEHLLRIKPDPPRKPIQVWVSVLDEKLFFSLKRTLSESHNDRRNVSLIEVGYCQPIPHDGSDVCPVNDNLPVVIYWKTAGFSCGIAKEIGGPWSNVTHYAVILPVEETP